MVSVEELAQDYLRALQEDTLGASLSVIPELTLAQAREAQRRLEKTSPEQRSPLLGLPVIHKDVLVTKGWPTTAGSRILENYQSPFNAHAVEQLQAAGMVCLGKANCDEFAMGSSNEHSAYQPARNPWDSERIPGGSSGGSAVAVAAGLAPAATGTDTGGSIRQPASMCGITGIKPTYGRVSRWGLVAYASSLDQAGPMARTAKDCAFLLSAMAGFDPKDSTSLEKAPEDFARLLGRPMTDLASAEQPLKGLRLGMPKQYFSNQISPAVAHAIEAGLEVLRGLGAETLTVDLPRTDLSLPAYYVIAPAEASSNLSRFDGVRYGHRSKNATDLESLYCLSRSEAFGPEVRRRILLGSYVLSHGYYDAYYLQAQKVRRLVAMDFDRAFEGCDFIVGPVSPVTAWGLGESPALEAAKDNPLLAEYLSDVFTLGASLAGLPAMSMPCGFEQHQAGARLPIGMQLIGPRFEEARMLALAHHFQMATDFHEQTPSPKAQGVQP
jgi:aspartyl-tRNA(Asn)/glutamyl-tRNA(Gln) amidotransferase subunit A